jgi:hypothetical protein
VCPCACACRSAAAANERKSASHALREWRKPAARAGRRAEPGPAFRVARARDHFRASRPSGEIGPSSPLVALCVVWRRRHWRLPAERRPALASPARTAQQSSPTRQSDDKLARPTAAGPVFKVGRRLLAREEDRRERAPACLPGRPAGRPVMDVLAPLAASPMAAAPMAGIRF